MEDFKERQTLIEVLELLENVQPHIPQACKRGHENFIDAYIDLALEKIRSSLKLD